MSTSRENALNGDPEKKQRRTLPTILTPPLQKTLVIALVLAAFMLANTVYLLINRLADAVDLRFFAAGKTSLPRLFQAMVLTHTGIGLILFILMLAFAILHFPRVWRRVHKSSVISGVAYVTIGLLLVLTGLFILSEAANRENRWAWWAHVVCAALVPAGYAAHRIVSVARPANRKFGKFFGTVGVLVLLLVVWHGFTSRGVVRTEEAELAREQGLDTGPGARNRHVREFLRSSFVPVGFVPPGSPFFPSAATTTSGGYLPSRIITRGDLGAREDLARDLAEYGFAKSSLIGTETCGRCHADIVAQWATSAHRFASFNNPFYEATIKDLRSNSNEPNRWVEEHFEAFPETADRAGVVKSKWCSGCHDPALMLVGQMNREIDRTTPAAQAGLTCLACHAIDKIHDRTGNGNYNVADEQEDPYLFATARSGSVRALLHDAILKAKPTVHKRQMLKPFFRKSEFCATCHKVSLTVPVNNYRWLRGQDEFDNWHDSGVALNASRTFYLPEQKRECQDCHMPLEPAVLGDVAAKNGKVRSHRFPAANTALPYLRGDRDTVERIEAFLQDERLSVDIFALRRKDRPLPLMALDRSKPVLSPGERVLVDVVVRNKDVGHTFPGGTNDSNEGWLEFSLRDEGGDLLAVSGEVGADGHLDPSAHVYKALILDKHGEGIHRRNAQDIHVTVFANVIEPGTADIAHYEFVVPQKLAGRSLSLQARLLWRKFDRKYTEFAFHANREGFKQFDAVPDLPITEIASVTVRLPVGSDSDSPPKESNGNAVDWMRFNDYGIGSLLEGDTRAAANAFEQVARLQPESIEGHLNLAKTAVRDGNINKAYEFLRKCEEIQPGNARVAWTWGVALQEDGAYENAAAAYKRALQQFPENRAAWRNLGRTYYLDQKYEDALDAFAKLLQIDPEDRIGHYHRMLCYRALGEEDKADTAEAAYEYYQVDESAKEITRAYRLKNPGANLMSQKIRTHVLKAK